MVSYITPDCQQRSTRPISSPCPALDAVLRFPAGALPHLAVTGSRAPVPRQPRAQPEGNPPQQRAGPAMPLAHFRLRPGASQPRLRRPLRLHSRLFAGSVAVLLGVLATGAGAASAADTAAPAKPAPAQPQPAKANTAPAPEFGPNVRIFDPSMPVAEIQATVDAIRGRTGRRRNGHQAVLLAVQARHLRQRRGAAHRPGRLLDGGRGPGRFTHGCHHQRARGRLQPVPDRGQLHRAEQLLALVVQPHHQRHRPRRLPRVRPTSGPPRRPLPCGGSTSPAAICP